MNFTRFIRPDDGDLFQLPAMVDVVFILLSFFVMAAEFRLNEMDFGMKYRSQAAGVGAITQDLPKSIPVELRKSANGVAITVGRARLGENDFAALHRKLAEINLPDTEVMVIGDPALSVDQVARALDAILASPMKRVALSRLAVASEKGAKP